MKQSHFLLEVLLNCVGSCQLKLVCCHNWPDFLVLEPGDEAAFDVFVGELTEMWYDVIRVPGECVSVQVLYDDVFFLGVKLVVENDFEDVDPCIDMNILIFAIEVCAFSLATESAEVLSHVVEIKCGHVESRNWS